MFCLATKHMDVYFRLWEYRKSSRCWGAV